ncbi:MAG: helix-turn-helix domain-containing protein [Inquilinaceae bacterium]
MTVAGQWSTDSLPPSLRGEAMRAMLNQVHLPWSLMRRDGDTFDCRLRWQGVGGCTLVECRSAPLAGFRRRREIRGTDAEHMGLLLVLAGSERIRQGEVSVRLRAGDLVLWDSAAPLDFAFDERLHKVTLILPKENVRRAGLIDNLKGTHVFDGRTGLGALLCSQMTALNRLAHQIPANDALLVADLMIDLLGRLLRPGDTPTAGRDLATRVLGHVERHLDDPDLSPSSIARRFGVTPRYLHMAFADSGRTLAAHIRARRLARIGRDLTDPRLDRMTITEIALRWGFNDPAHASRVFHRHFGMPPSRYRNRIH